MKTTNKAFKALIQTHIIDRLDNEEYQEIHFQLNNVVESFNDWYSIHEQKEIPNKYNAFKHWLMCLPSCIHIEFASYEIMLTLKGWFESFGEVYKEKESDKELLLYLHLVTREFDVLCKKHNIRF